MTKETLQADFTKALNSESVLYTRLRTPMNRYRGVRYPADFVVWGESETWLVECKQRSGLPLAPSDIRQLPFMKDWYDKDYLPKARYVILVGTDKGYFIFDSKQAVEAAKIHKGLKEEQALWSADTLKGLIRSMAL